MSDSKKEKESIRSAIKSFKDNEIASLISDIQPFFDEEKKKAAAEKGKDKKETILAAEIKPVTIKSFSKAMRDRFLPDFLSRIAKREDIESKKNSFRKWWENHQKTPQEKQAPAIDSVKFLTELNQRFGKRCALDIHKFKEFFQPENIIYLTKEEREFLMNYVLIDQEVEQTPDAQKKTIDGLPGTHLYNSDALYESVNIIIQSQREEIREAQHREEKARRQAISKQEMLKKSSPEPSPQEIKLQKLKTYEERTKNKLTELLEAKIHPLLYALVTANVAKAEKRILGQEPIQKLIEAQASLNSLEQEYEKQEAKSPKKALDSQIKQAEEQILLLQERIRANEIIISEISKILEYGLARTSRALAEDKGRSAPLQSEDEYREEVRLMEEKATKELAVDKPKLTEEQSELAKAQTQLKELLDSPELSGSRIRKEQAKLIRDSAQSALEGDELLNARYKFITEARAALIPTLSLEELIQFAEKYCDEGEMQAYLSAIPSWNRTFELDNSFARQLNTDSLSFYIDDMRKLCANWAENARHMSVVGKFHIKSDSHTTPPGAATTPGVSPNFVRV